MKYIIASLLVLVLAGCGNREIESRYDALLQGKALIIKQNDKNEVVDVEVFTADQLTNNIVYSGDRSVTFCCLGELVDEPVTKGKIGGDPVTVYCKNGMVVGLNGRNPIVVFGSPLNNQTLKKVEKYLSNK